MPDHTKVGMKEDLRVPDYPMGSYADIIKATPPENRNSLFSLGKSFRELLTLCVFSLLAVLHLLLKHVFLGFLLDDLPSSDSRRTYLWSPSEDPPHPFFSVAQRCTSENTPHLLCRLPVHPPMSAVIRNLRHTLSTPRTANFSHHGCTHPPRLQIQLQSTRIPPKPCGF
ncbi:hypothetical protein ATANTOWER_020473 [Ataeniobius toweri]|uniref:Uncharacterized protein n=1 Tax=Ataeniobius toweri TaxID=208326 RepID=A0ABU7C2Y8_9TELE|nr:hypothetical protein [Ataeniobius toweri]